MMRHVTIFDVPKTRHSVRKVALPDGLSADIAEWRSMSPSVEPDAWVFLLRL